MVIGIIAAVLLGRFIENQLFEVRSFDPLTIVAMVYALMTAALLASWLPTRRAMGLNLRPHCVMSKATNALRTILVTPR